MVLLVVTRFSLKRHAGRDYERYLSAIPIPYLVFGISSCTGPKILCLGSLQLHARNSCEGSVPRAARQMASNDRILEAHAKSSLL